MAPRTRLHALALLCAAAVAVAACSFGGDGDDESATTSTTSRRSRATTEETVLGTVEERELAPAPPAEPVLVPTTAAPTTTTARPAPRPTTATVPPTTTTIAPTTTTAPPRPNHINGAYEARPSTTSVTVELYREGVLAATRDLAGSGGFAFDDLPPGVYRVLITDRQVDGDTSSEVVTACPEVGLSDGDTAYVDAAWDRDCTVLLASD